MIQLYQSPGVWLKACIGLVKCLKHLCEILGYIYECFHSQKSGVGVVLDGCWAKDQNEIS